MKRRTVTDTILVTFMKRRQYYREQSKQRLLRMLDGDRYPYLGKLVIGDHDLPIVSIRLTKGMVTMEARMGVGKAVVLEGPMTVFGSDDQGVMQSAEQFPRVNKMAIDTLVVKYNCKVVLVE